MKTKYPLLPFLISLLLAASLLQGQNVQAPLPLVSPAQEGFSIERLDTLNSRLREIVDEGRASGFVTLVARNGRIVDWRTYGKRDIAANLAMEKDSIFRIYSMSKIIASVGVLILFEEGRLRLDDPVEKYIPELKDRMVFTGGTLEKPELVPAKGPVTIRHLLSHTSGYYYGANDLPVLEQIYRMAAVPKAESLQDFIQRVSTLPLAGQPGTAFRYGISTDILGYVIEKVSGKRVEAFLQDRICAPLGMVDTAFDVPAEKQARLAKSYKRDAAGKLVESDANNPVPKYASCGGGLYSTPADYLRFAEMLANGGELKGKRILGRKTIELMTQNQLQGLASPFHAYSTSSGFGLGVEVMIDLSKSKSPGSLGQFGWAGAATTLCQIDPVEHLVMLAFFQHKPMDESGIYNLFMTGVEASLVDSPAPIAPKP